MGSALFGLVALVLGVEPGRLVARGVTEGVGAATRVGFVAFWDVVVAAGVVGFVAAGTVVVEADAVEGFVVWD